MAVEIEQFLCHEDNIGVLVHHAGTGETAIVDAPEERAILEALERTGWQPTMILTTHHHRDHVEANLALKERFELTVYGPRAEAERIPGIDETVGEDDAIRFGDETVEVIETPGHTSGHVAYHFPQSGVVFTGDTLFALGCGRLFEEKPPAMLASLRKLATLPLDTRVYCGHNYTLSNARFALSVDPTNSALKERVKEIEWAVESERPTLPSTIGLEMATNPFLRWHDPALRRNLGMKDASDEAVFAEIRKRKDIF